jgi:multidrug efflux pump subunit AcrA (membrane-fusion protein)
MSIQRSKRTLWIGLGAAVALALLAWMVGQEIRSPAQIAAETAPPKASAITVPVERQVLSSEVIVRGTVRYGSPQDVVLASSELKQSGSAGPSDIVTTPPRRGSRVSEGMVSMSVSGRPVFVLRGAQASHRDLGLGSRGPDVRQLEAALARLGFSPGSVDGRYDGQTAAAVAAWYEDNGWEPFGPTDTQLDQLNTARAAAAAARDAYLQSQVAIETARDRATPAEIEQARIELETARDALDTAKHGLSSQDGAVSLAIANQRRDDALAAAEVALKRAGVNKAFDALAEAKRNFAELPPDASPSERAAIQATLRQAGDDVNVAQADLNASIASQRATRAAGRGAVAKARADVARARKALPTARRQVRLASRRLRVLTTPGDTGLQRSVSQAAATEARRTDAEVARLARKAGIHVPADEVLFFPTLPLRVDSVRVRRGDAVSGRVMTVSNSRLAVDSSLSINDAKLVRAGAPVKIEESDLGVQATGKVTQVSDRPGTHKVDPARVYLQVTPKTAPAQLVGASVKLTIAVKSTERAVLVVPVTALSVGADGNARVQVRRADGRTEYVTVEPGLAAKGLVEVRPVRRGLEVGDLVIAGDGGSLRSSGTPPGGTPGGGGTPSGGGSSGGGSSGAPDSGAAGATGASGQSEPGGGRNGGATSGSTSGGSGSKETTPPVGTTP